jgi:hypothetical protein
MSDRDATNSPSSPPSSFVDSGHPLTGPCQEAIAFFRNPLSVASKSKHNPAATRLPADSNRTRFLALLAANRIAPVTHQVQACRDVLRPPWRRWPPQRNVGTKPCPRGWSHWCGCRKGDASPQRAHGLGDSVICTPSGGTKTASNHSGGCAPDRSLAHRLWPNHYMKQRCTSKGFCSRSMW